MGTGIIKVFPKVLYHPVGGHKTVLTQEELDKHLAEGWETSPAKTNEGARLRKVLKYHMLEMEKTAAALAELEGTDIDAILDEFAPPEADAVPETEPEGVEGEPLCGCGRPKNHSGMCKARRDAKKEGEAA